VFHQSLHNQEVQNVFHFTNKQEFPNDDELNFRTTDLCDEFFTRVVPNWTLATTQQLHFVKITNVCLIPRLGPAGEKLIEVGTGALANDSLPSYCAAIVSVQTGLSGRSRRGRFFMAGMPEDFCSNSQLEPDQFDLVQAVADTMFGNFSITGSDFFNEWIHYSKHEGFGDGVYTMAGAFVITRVLARRNLGTQRHRLIGHGT